MPALFLIDDAEFVVGGPASIDSLELAVPVDLGGVRPSTASRNAMLNGVRDIADAGAGAAKVKFYDGIQPATGDDLPTGILLATLTCSLQSAPDASDGSLVFNPITAALVAANGTATWARIEDSDGNPVLDGPVEEA